MKGMVLAAGVGERMRPLTDVLPKPLLQVSGRALLDYHINALALAGVTDLVINVHHHADKIIRHVEGYKGLNIRVLFEPTLLETAGGIVNALEYLGATPFIVVSSDVYTDYDYSKLVTRDTKAAHLVMVDNPPHHPTGDFSLDAQGILGGDEPKLTYSGIGLYHAGFFAGVARGSRKLRELMDRAVTARELTGEHHQGLWSDVGTPERLAELNR